MNFHAGFGNYMNKNVEFNWSQNKYFVLGSSSARLERFFFFSEPFKQYYGLNW